MVSLMLRTEYVKLFNLNCQYNRNGDYFGAIVTTTQMIEIAIKLQQLDPKNDTSLIGIAFYCRAQARDKQKDNTTYGFLRKRKSFQIQRQDGLSCDT